jgi:hypothetical protein
MPQAAAHRNRACDTLHLGWAMRAGTAKRSRLILESWGKTLDHRRLFTSGLLYRFTDATAGKNFAPFGEQRRFSVLNLFACTAESEANTLLRVSHRFSCKVLRAFTKEF